MGFFVFIPDDEESRAFLGSSSMWKSQMASIARGNIRGAFRR